MITRLSQMFLRLSIRLTPGPFNAYVMERATSLAVSASMAYLDREGFRHCARCARRAPLKNVNGVYLCQSHAATSEAVRVEVSTNGHR